MRLGATRLRFKILIITYILLLTSYITALIYIKSIYLWVYLIILTFNLNISGRYKVAAIYSFFLEFNSPKARSVS